MSLTHWMGFIHAQKGSQTCPCPCVTAHLVINRHAVASAPFFAPSFTPPPHTSSIQGKEALCAHSCITISGKIVHNSSTMPCLGCPREALFLLGNLLEFCLTRCADRHMPTCEPGLDLLPIFRANGQKTIRAACPCLVVTRIAGQWVPCCALNVHRCTSWLTHPSRRALLAYDF